MESNTVGYNSLSEKELVTTLKKLSILNTFAQDILNNKKDIINIVNSLKKAPFENYSGAHPGDFNNVLGKFFYIARYVDSKKEDFKNCFEKGSPLDPSLLTKKEETFDFKPWKIKFANLPDYTKNFIYDSRLDSYRILGELLKLPSFRLPKQNEGTQKPDEYKAYILSHIGTKYDTINDSQRLSFLSQIATCGTTNPIVQSQVDNRPFIQGYLMNILNLNSGDPAIRAYYQKAIDMGLGLLSGPSGTSNRVYQLVKGLYGKDNYKFLTVALCMAALNDVYKNHSFYEIVTVIIPDFIGKCTTGDEAIEKFKIGLKEDIDIWNKAYKV